MSDRIRLSLATAPEGPVPDGPDFLYEAGPELFLGRRGRGPLRIMWDTNLLIDYFQHGRSLWDGDALPESVPAGYGEQLEGLQLVVAVWVLRDIRFSIPARALTDARARLPPDRAQARSRALQEFSAALQLAEWDDPCTDPGRHLLVLPLGELEDALGDVPAGGDRELVAEAVRTGMHVFMTRDAGILRAAPRLRPFGLVLASPLDVVELLCASGGFHCLLDSRFIRWPIPDLQRISHLIQALPG